MAAPLWTPSADRVKASQLAHFWPVAERIAGRVFRTYADLHEWSVLEPEDFWASMWDHGGVIGERGGRVTLDLDRRPGARFFPDARLNFTENLLRGDDARVAILATTEAGGDRAITLGELRRDVARVSHALRAAGVEPGDRVVGIMANVPEAIVATLGAAAIGAVWSSCSPDFGVDGILDRFGQIEPVVLIAVDGYHYGGKRFDCRRKIADVAARLPSVRQLVCVSLVGLDVPASDNIPTTSWRSWLGRGSDAWPVFERFPFDQPLYVLFSSGTTGVPKCIVHRAGGTLLEHLKELQLQTDVQPGDRFFYFTTCGWMMWNWLVSGLAAGATLVLYDGSPFHPDGHALFAMAERFDVTVFGTSAKWIDSVRKAGLRPRDSHELTSLRTIASTGSPLSAESFAFVYDAIAPDVLLTSLSGGTDIVGCFAGGNPTGPVWAGELQAPGLGMDVRIFDDAGEPIVGTPGELICANGFPTMPLGFWNDPGDVKYRQAYFERFPGVWCHGDWAEQTAHGGFIIHGRSDATLNPGGVRIGTAEIYRQVEHFPEVVESVAVGQPWEGDERIILFVRLAPGVTLDADLQTRLVRRIRERASPRHVPAHIIAVDDIPRTRSGKIAELAVRRAMQGMPVPNTEALANPECLDAFRTHPALTSA